jgi:HipA-like protein
MARVLDVYLGPRLAGHFTQDDSGSLWFAYAADWLADARAVPLSRSLPLRAEPYERNQCRPFFAGLLPEDQQEGGPNLKKCFDLIRSASTAPGPDVLRLFDAVVFNYLIGNHDAHGKNFSLLYDGQSVRLAPLYDLVCTQAWENLASTMAMKIGDARKPERVFAANWRKFFKDAGLGEATAEKRLQSLAKTTVAALREMEDDHLAGARLRPIITENGRHLLSLDW